MAETVENLVVRLSFDNAGFNSGISAINRNLKLIQSEFQASAAKLKDFGNGTDGLKLKADSLTKQLDLQRQKLSAYQSKIAESTEILQKNRTAYEKLGKELDDTRKAYEASIRVNGKESEETKKLAEEVTKLEAEYKKSGQAVQNNVKTLQNYQIKANGVDAAIGKLENELRAVNEQLERQPTRWQKLSAKIGDAGQKMKTIGQGFSNVGRSLTFGLTLPVAGAVTGVTKAAVDFESAFTGVRKTVNASNEEFKELEKGIRDMSKRMPISASDIAKVAESAGQLGIKTSAILDFTKTMIDLGNSTNLSADDAASALARLANITQMPQTEFRRLGSTIVALGNNLATTESEITEMALRLAGAGHQVGMTEDQIVSFAGALSSVGIEAEAGGTAFSKVFLNIQTAVISGNKNLKNFAKVAGMSAKQFQQAYKKDAAGAIIAFIEGLGKLQKSGADVTTVLNKLGFSDVRVRDALLRASGAGDLFRKSLELGSKAWKENTALTKEANTRYKTTASQLQIFKNKLTDVGIDLGRALIPALIDTVDALEPVIQSIKNAAKWFSELDPRMQKTIIGFGAVVAAIGPLSMMIGPLVTGLGALSIAFSTAGVSMMAVLGPIGLVVGALTAAGIAAFAFSGKQKELQKVSLDTANSMIKQHDANAKMIQSFDDLRIKSQLTNDEFARYVDLQSQLKDEKDPEAIAAIKDEMDKLQKKSGLSNKQLQKMVDLNKALTDKLPAATDKITEQGNRIVGTTDKLKKYNEELANATLRELDIQYQKSLANQKTLLKQKKDLQSQINESVKEENRLLELVKNYNKEDIKKQIEKEQSILAQLRLQNMSNEKAGIHDEELQKQIKHHQAILDALNGGKNKLIEQLDASHKNTEELQSRLKKTDDEIAKYDVVRKKLESQLLVQAGINQAVADQAVKQGNEIDLIDLTIAKLQAQKNQLEKQTPPNLRNTEEYKKQVSSIDDQIEKLEAARGQIVDMTSAAKNYNDTIGKSIWKKVKVDLDFSNLNWREKQIVMGQARAYVQMQGFATGTNNYPGGWGIVGEEGPELVQLPRGSKIFPNNITEALLRKLSQLPKLATGGEIVKSGLALVGERGRELYQAPAAASMPLTNGANAMQPQVVAPEYVVVEIQLDSGQMARVLAKPLTKEQERMKYANKRQIKGRMK